jgi:hypothetical protein
MKTLTEVSVNGDKQNTIIDYSMSPIRDEKTGNPTFTNEKEKIAKHKGGVDEIVIYIRDDNDFRKFMAIKISSASIKHLYEKITEIESLESEEVIDD